MVTGHLTKKIFAARAHFALGGPFYPLFRTPDHHTHTSASFTSHPNTPHHLKLSTLPFTPRKTAKSHLRTCAWTGGVFSVALGSILDYGAWLGSGRCSMDVIQRPGGIRAWRYDPPSFVSHYNTDAYNEAPMPTVSELLSRFMRGTLPPLLVATFVVSLLPLSKDNVLGNSGEVFFSLPRFSC